MEPASSSIPKAAASILTAHWFAVFTRSDVMSFPQEKRVSLKLNRIRSARASMPATAKSWLILMPKTRNLSWKPQTGISNYSGDCTRYWRKSQRNLRNSRLSTKFFRSLPAGTSAATSDLPILMPLQPPTAIK